jgi:hypothetical protein
MFYRERDLSPALRLGDVLRGCVLGVTRFDKPLPQHDAFAIDVATPPFVASLTPCCSVGDQTLLLAPLRKVNPNYFKNPHFAEDLTRINRRMDPHLAVPPEVWETRIPPEERARRVAGGQAYALLEIFVYAPNPLLPTYPLRLGSEEFTVGHYVIDFRTMHRVQCRAVVSPERVPLEEKRLELSIQARSELRDKLAAFFARRPAEDMV